MVKVLEKFDAEWLRGQVAAWFADGAVWGVGVSGGGDSSALLAGLVKAGFGKQVVALCMNNGWGEADEEAERYVRDLGEKLGVEVVVGQGAGMPEGGSWEEVARDERLALFEEEVRGRGLAGVMLAHNAEDVAEHLLMRLGRGSGLAGLAGLRVESVVEGVRLVRPLLEVTRGALRGFLKAEGMGWHDDPFNDDAGKMRGRVRKLLPALWEAGLTLDGMVSAAAALGEADAVVEGQVAGVVAKMVVGGEGVLLSREVLAGLEVEMAARVMQALLSAVGCGEVVRRSKRLALWERVCGEAKGVGELGGCRWVWDGDLISIRKS